MMLCNKFTVLAVTLQCLLAIVVAVQPLKIISIVSNSSGVDTPLWGRGEELIPGALLAAQQVNSNEDVLNGFHIEVTPLFVQDCSVSEGILKTGQELLSTDNLVIGVTGLFCPRLVKVLSPLLCHKEMNIIQLSGATTVDMTIDECRNSNALPGIGGTQIEALFNLLEILNWSNFNLVSIRSRTRLKDYYTEVERAIVRRATMDSNWLVLEARIDSSLENLLEMLRWSTSPIIIAVLPPETAADLLCYAYKNKMTWPRYGWIMLDLTVSESAQCGSESLLRAMENVIVLKSKLEQNKNLTIFSNITYSNYIQQVEQLSSSTIPHNPYTNVLYDSVWALALAVNSSLQALQHSNLTLTAKTVFGTLDKEAVEILKESLVEITFTGASGEFKNGNIQTLLEIYQIQNGSYITIGNRYSHDNATVFQLDLLGETRPQDEIPRVYQHIPDAMTITVSVGISLAVVFVTVVLVAFFCSWRQPEVRASSRVLSLCIFLGSYLLLISSLTDNVFASVYVDPGGVPVCIIIPALAFVGMDLILATVLAKTLRIAYIFNKFKKNINCSDYILFAMIALIVGGKVFLLIVWNAIDVNHIEDIPNPVLTLNDDGFLQYNVFQQCYSEYQLMWVALIVIYTLLICLALALVSYITRKIRRANYKDTKKINAFLFTALIVILPTIALWWVFRFVGLYQASTIASTVGYSSTPILCQVFLIIPKIGPGLKRHCC